MTNIGNLANLAQTGQSLALVGHNIQRLQKKNIDAKDIVEIGATNIVGIGLIKATGQVAGGL